MALVPGSTAGPYRIVEPLGRGGMASVYKAYEPALDRYVALKVLPREFLHDPDFARRFEQEARAIAKLEHPNIVPIYNYAIDEAEGIPWMAMRLVGGGSLSQLVKGQLRPLPLARSTEILGEVAEALDHAHSKGIVHRDVKPQNVLLDEGGRVYLADFGIAKILESSGGLTATGMITGTPQYMAPEQAMAGKVGPFTDVYALGIVAYEMFTGRVPFAADTPLAIIHKHVHDPLPIPSPAEVPEPMLRAILKCTAKSPEDRWPTAGGFVHALQAGLDARTVPIEDVPTLAVGPSAAPTVVSRPTAVPAPTAPASQPTRPAAAQTVVSPPPVPQQAAARGVPVAPARRGSRSMALFAAGGVFVLVLAGLLAVRLFMQRGDDVPPASPSPAAMPEAAPRPEPSPALATPSPPAPTTVAVAEPRREAATPTPAAAASRPQFEPRPTPLPTPTPAPTATPTPAPARPTEPAAPAVDPEVQRLGAALADRDTAARRRAAQDLASLGPAAAPAVPALTAALADRSPDVRLRAAEAIGRVGPSAATAIPGLVQALRDADPMVQAEAAKSLGLLNEAAAPASAPLGDALASSDVAVRREAARALARVGRGAEPALRALLAALKDKDKTVRAQAARALGRIGPAAREAVPALTVMSRDSDVFVSREAREALQGIGP